MKAIGPLALALAIALMLAGVGRAAGAASSSREATSAAVHLLARAVRVEANGRNHQLIKALRRLGDSELKPLFQALTAARHPARRVHGILGLAELSQDQSVDLRQVASLSNTSVQSELLSSALDAGLVSPRSARTMLGWDGLDIGVKLLICARQIEHERFDPANMAILRRAAKSRRLGRRALADLLLVQTGDRQAVDTLMALNHEASDNGETGQTKANRQSADQSNHADQPRDQSQDAVRLMLVRTILAHKMNRAASWAGDVARSTPGDSALSCFALRAAMRFGQRRAISLWQRRFKQADNEFTRLRYALLGLRVSPWLSSKPFEMLAHSDQAVIRRIGQAAKSIARGGDDIAQQVVGLAQIAQPLVNRWAVEYADQQASSAARRRILLAVIHAAALADDEPGDRSTSRSIEGANEGGVRAGHDPRSRSNQAGRRRLLAAAIDASEVLYDADPRFAAKRLGAILAGEDVRPRLKQAVLLGLARSQHSSVQPPLSKVLAGHFTTRGANQLALVVRARANGKLTHVDLADLGVIARGGGNLSSTLRMQAAWFYLKHTGQAEAALGAVINQMRRSGR